MTAPQSDSAPALVVAGGARNGEVLVLEAPGLEKMMGSGGDCHLRFPSAGVDGHHAVVVWDDSRGVLIRDQASATGTWVNGERVATERPLQDGDRISLGPPGSVDSVKLLVQVPPHLEAPLVLDADEGGLFGAPVEFSLPAEDEEEVFDASGQETFADAVPADLVFDPVAPEPPPPPAVHVPPPPTPPRIAPPPAVVFEPDPPASAPAARRSTYTDELPSIVTDAPRDRVVLPPPGPPRRAKRGGVSPVVVLGGLAAFLVAGVLAFLAVRSFFGNKKEGAQSASAPAAAAEAARGPRAATLDPDVAVPGAEVVLRGQNLAGAKVTVNRMPATIRNGTATEVRFEVPRLESMMEGQGVIVVAQVGSEATKPLTLTIGTLPLLLQMEPLRGETGSKVVLRGRGFDPNPAGNEVSFAGERALVVAASDRQLEVLVPTVSAPGNNVDAPVRVRVGASASRTPLEFTVLRPSIGMYIPRFFPAPVREDPARVFVASEAGPLLLLSSADGNPSVAARAAGVATALNGLFQVSTPPAIEVRPGEPPAVAVAGAPQPLVRATAEDAAGYTQPWNTVMKGQRASAPALAAHWAALLQDYVTLFAARQRPTRVVEVTPRGKVLLDIFSEGERRLGRGGGVPAGLLCPPAPTLASSLRELALALPARAQAVPGAALVGRWAGTMEESGIGQRAVQLRLRLDGTRLAGAMSTRAGQVSMDIPLKNVAYDKGLLSFEVGGGALRRFAGTTSGSTLTGTISDQARKEIGRFTLQYSE